MLKGTTLLFWPRSRPMTSRHDDAPFALMMTSPCPWPDCSIPRVIFFYTWCTLKGSRLKSTHSMTVKLCHNMHNGLLLWFSNFLGGIWAWKGPNFTIFCKMSTIAKTNNKETSKDTWVIYSLYITQVSLTNGKLSKTVYHTGVHS